MDRESLIELQKIDCNCNDCKFMERDFERFNKWKEWRKEQQLKDFQRKKAKAINDAKALENNRARQIELQKAINLQFQFNSSGLLNYGKCTKLKKDVSFIPGVCQIETQECFVHRRDG